MSTNVQKFATRSGLIRQAIATHKAWIEEKLGVPFSDAAIIDGLPNLSQVGVQEFLGISIAQRSGNRESRRLRPLVEHAEIPPQYPASVSMVNDMSSGNPLEALLTDRSTRRGGFEWGECPLALRLHVYNCTIVILNVHYHDGPASTSESEARLLVARRDELSKIMQLLEDLCRRNRAPNLHTIGSGPRRASRVKWSDLVIDQSVRTLLQNDFESFWERHVWFRERNLPFRRGYLLHGPPGNGKTSAIRAMMSSRDLNAYTLRVFDPTTDDRDLDELFERAHRDRPAIILFEDIDRAFPKTGESRAKISLQHLLNSLDGVASLEGIVVVATANEPAVLDPAILRRPGRFDRLVHFPNPNDALRLEYFRKMNTGLAIDSLRGSIKLSNGLSFAQLKEAYVLSGQLAFERGEEVTADDLMVAIRSLRQGMIDSSRHTTAAGFSVSGEAKPDCERSPDEKL